MGYPGPRPLVHVGGSGYRTTARMARSSSTDSIRWRRVWCSKYHTMCIFVRRTHPFPRGHGQEGHSPRFGQGTTALWAYHTHQTQEHDPKSRFQRRLSTVWRWPLVKAYFCQQKLPNLDSPTLACRSGLYPGWICERLNFIRNLSVMSATPSWLEFGPRTVQSLFGISHSEQRRIRHGCFDRHCTVLLTFALRRRLLVHTLGEMPFLQCNLLFSLQPSLA